jgi:hypothetical protein
VRKASRGTLRDYDNRLKLITKTARMTVNHLPDDRRKEIEKGSNHKDYESGFWIYYCGDCMVEIGNEAQLAGIICYLPLPPGTLPRVSAWQDPKRFNRPGHHAG